MYSSRAKTQLSESIYRLKLEQGEPITWITSSGETLNVNTGVMSEDNAEIPIHRAVVMPADLINKAKYSITYLASNKNFVYDGMYGLADLVVLIDLRDVPFRDFDNRSEERIRLQNGWVFEIAKIEYYLMEVALVVSLKAVTNG